MEIDVIRKNVNKEISLFWKNISPRFRKSLIWIFIVLLIVSRWNSDIQPFFDKVFSSKSMIIKFLNYNRHWISFYVVSNDNLEKIDLGLLVEIVNRTNSQNRVESTLLELNMDGQWIGISPIITRYESEDLLWIPTGRKKWSSLVALDGFLDRKLKEQNLKAENDSIKGWIFYKIPNDLLLKIVQGNGVKLRFGVRDISGKFIKQGVVFLGKDPHESAEGARAEFTVKEINGDIPEQIRNSHLIIHSKCPIFLEYYKTGLSFHPFGWGSRFYWSQECLYDIPGMVSAGDQLIMIN